MHGAPGDAHLHSDVSGVCRGPSCVLEALWRNGRVHIYRDLRAEQLQLARFSSPRCARSGSVGRKESVENAADRDREAVGQRRLRPL